MEQQNSQRRPSSRRVTLIAISCVLAFGLFGGLKDQVPAGWPRGLFAAAVFGYFAWTLWLLAKRNKQADGDFLRLMLFKASRADEKLPDQSTPQRITGDYAPLRHSMAKAGDRYELPTPVAAAPVRLDSPATDVMTDLRRVSAVTVNSETLIADANQVMIARNVRNLFVVDDARQVFGIVTATDLLNERPIQVAQARGIRYDKVVVRDIMTPADRLEVLDLHDVLRARVGDVVATLKIAGRQHALIVEVEGTEGRASCRRTVRGIFSLTQIARQLGIPPQPVHDIARTFADIEAVIAS